MRDIDNMLKEAFSDLENGGDPGAAAFIKYYIKHLKDNIRLAYKVGLGDLFNAACDNDDLDYINDKMFELKDKANWVNLNDLLDGLNRKVND